MVVGAAVVTIDDVGRTEEVGVGLTDMLVEDTGEVDVAGNTDPDTDPCPANELVALGKLSDTVGVGSTDIVVVAVMRPMVAIKTTKQEAQFI